MRLVSFAILGALVGLAFPLVPGCDEWPGLEGRDGGVVSGASQIEDSSGRLGSSCSGASCQSGLTCFSGFPGGLCSKTCQSNADCSGGVCVASSSGLVCLVTCFNDQTCRPGYACQSTGEATVCAPGSTTSVVDAGTD